MQEHVWASVNLKDVENYSKTEPKTCGKLPSCKVIILIASLFPKLPFLRDLSVNNITSLPTGVFAPLTNLQEL